MKHPDMLEAYLEGVPQGERDGARQLLHGMRLFALSAQKDLSPKVDLPIQAARNALLELRSKQLKNSLGLLLVHQFAGQPIEAAVFGTWPEWHWLPGVEAPEPVTRGEAFDAWTYLLQQWPGGVERPMPGESTSSTAELLLAAAVQWHVDPAWLRLWRIRIEWIQKGPDFAGKALKRWCDQYESSADPCLRTTVLEHRLSLALVGGNPEIVELLENGIARGASGKTGAHGHLVLQRGKCELAAKADLSARRPLSAIGLSRQTPGDGAVPGFPPRWTWDGIWGTTGCWVACCPDQRKPFWAMATRGSRTLGEMASPDDLERRALTELGLVYSMAVDSSPPLGASPGSDAHMRASVCVTHLYSAAAEEVPLVGPVLGWVTWEWAHDRIPPGAVLLAAARRLIVGHLGAHGGRGGRGVIYRPADMNSNACTERWLGALGDRAAGCGRAILWEKCEEGWRSLKDEFGSVRAGQDQGGARFEDLERCRLLGFPTGVSGRNGLAAGGLIPLSDGSEARNIVEWRAIDKAEDLSKALALAAPLMDYSLWSLASFLDRNLAGNKVARCIPMGDPSFTRFVRRLWRAFEQAQHLAIVSDVNGLGPILAAWLNSQRRVSRVREWECVCVTRPPRGECPGHHVFARWEVRGEAFQVFHLPRLRDRRNELLGWVTRMADPSGESGSWTDDALAVLWRQDWTGEEPQLLSVVSRILQAQSEEIGAPLVEQVLEERQMKVTARLDSKRPRPADITAALHTTRRKSGRWNKTRAGSFLGWDPDTLVARMKDLGWKEDGVPDPDPWL